MLARGMDTALLRYSLGNECLKQDRPADAVEHLLLAVTMDDQYSAAWKALGKAQNASGLPDDALQSYRRGIGIAEANGDKQAAKEMTVFARRLEKQLR